MREENAIRYGANQIKFNHLYTNILHAFLNGRRVQLAHLATFHRLPAIYALREYAEAGGLISYGTNLADAYRHVRARL